VSILTWKLAIHTLVSVFAASFDIPTTSQIASTHSELKVKA